MAEDLLALTSVTAAIVPLDAGMEKSVPAASPSFASSLSPSPSSSISLLPYAASPDPAL